MSDPPPNKRIKSGKEFVDSINQCYELQFKETRNDEEDALLKSGIQKIRETLEMVGSSSDVSFGSSRPAAKLHWGKCLGLLFAEENEPHSFAALNVLCERLMPGGGLI